jgi:hypothetical protein
MVVLLCAVPFLCVSCLGLGIPKTSGLESPASLPEGEIDERLIGTWEVQYRQTDNGSKEYVRSRTLIEFTDKGELIFNRVDREKEDQLKTEAGRYTVVGDSIIVLDTQGHRGRWQYKVSEDNLVIMMSDKGEEIHCQKVQ